MFDPVNNFNIPAEWIKRSSVPYEKLEILISSGCYVLLSNGSLLRRGYTTGSTAAAAAKSAVLSLIKDVSEVEIPTPIGLRIKIHVTAEKGRASVLKLSGDHASDATDRIEIIAEANEDRDIQIIAGKGIGIKNHLPAINPSPMRQIEASVREGIIETGLKGAHIVISVPLGEEIAKKTLNEKLGIAGGISILGTTGFVEPWNEHTGALREELIREAERVVLTTGRTGLRFCNMLFPDYAVVLIGSDISRGLAAARGEVIICGLPGLILKWAYPEILISGGKLTVQELIDDAPSNPVIDEALRKAVKKSGSRIVLLKKDGTIFRDSAVMDAFKGDI